ncbi:MAG: hypothetical protein AAF441_29700, partial [Pseudomonadota bacterium]
MSRIFLSAPDISGRERDLVTEVFDSNYIAPAGAMLTKFEEDMSAMCLFIIQAMAELASHESLCRLQ